MRSVPAQSIYSEIISFRNGGVYKVEEREYQGARK